MRVLLISQFYYPESVAAAHRTHSFAKALKAAGHEVTVIAAKPNHPQGIIREDYRGGLTKKRTYDGIPVLHTWIFTSRRKSFLTRISFYVSFMLMAIFASFKARGRYDVVLASSPPLFVGISGWVVSVFKRAKFVFDVRDLWPDLAVAMGELGNPRIIKWAKWMEHFIYRKAAAVTTATRSFREDIEAVVAPGKPVFHVTNGTEAERFQYPPEARNGVRAQLGLGEAFTAMYVGNVGICQGLLHLLDAAETLQTQGSPVQLVVVGGGPVRQVLMDGAEDRGLTNIQFQPQVTMQEAAGFMAAADALIVPLADHDIYRKFIPSKLFDCMAAGRPVLLAVDGEARAILDEAQAGLFYPPEQGAALAEQIEWMRTHPAEVAPMGPRGEQFVRERYLRSVQARRLVDFLERLTASASPALPPEAPVPAS